MKYKLILLIPIIVKAIPLCKDFFLTIERFLRFYFINVSYNILAYCVYLLFMFPIIISIGQMCYTNGLVYAMQIFDNDQQLTLSTNKILLICYYLLNLGYTLFSIGTWSQIYDIAHIIADVCSKMGVLLLLLGIIHILNMLMIIYVAYFRKEKIHR